MIWYDLICNDVTIILYILILSSCVAKCLSDNDCQNKRKLCLCDGICGMSCIRPEKVNTIVVVIMIIVTIVTPFVQYYWKSGMPRVAGSSQWTSSPHWPAFSGCNIYQAHYVVWVFICIDIEIEASPFSRKVGKDNLRNTCRYIYVWQKHEYPCFIPISGFHNLPQFNFVKHLPTSFIQYGTHSSIHWPWIALWILIWLGRRRNGKHLRQSPQGRIYYGFQFFQIQFSNHPVTDFSQTWWPFRY